VLKTDKSGADMITDLVWSQTDKGSFATVGPKHYCIWTWKDGACNKIKVNNKASKSDKYCSVATIEGAYFAGASDGWVVGNSGPAA
jgi:hypothetical protein